MKKTRSFGSEIMAGGATFQGAVRAKNFSIDSSERSSRRCHVALASIVVYGQPRGSTKAPPPGLFELPVIRRSPQCSVLLVYCPNAASIRPYLHDLLATAVIRASCDGRRHGPS